MSQDENPKTLINQAYQLEAVAEGGTPWVALRITTLKTGKEEILPGVNDITGAGIFEHALAEILGSRQAVINLYRHNNRPLITEEGYQRMRRVYSVAHDHS